MSDLDLSQLAIDLAKWLTKNSTDGLHDHVDGEVIQKAFSAPAAELEEALAELEMEGYVNLTKFLGPGLPHVRLTDALFVDFDPDVMGTDPVEDAATLVEIVVNAGEAVNVSELHGQSGWTKRRFNPALSVLLSYVDERHISRTLQDEYATGHFFLDARDRVELKRFLRDVTE